MKFTAEFKFKTSLFLALLSPLLSPLPSFASFEPLPVGARAAGMGEAYSAIVDDVYSLYYNPAGVLQVNRPEIGSYYSQLYPGLTDNSQISRLFLGYCQPLGKDGKKGAMGANYISMELPGLYKEESFGLTWGYDVRHRWNFGGTLKMLRKSIGTDEYTANAINPISGNATGTADPLLAAGRSASALGIDLGFQYRLNQSYAMGLVARNANNPDVGLNGSKDKAPLTINAALARRWRSGSLGLEIMKWDSAGSNLRYSLGGERWFKNGFGIRAGVSNGSRSYSALSFGASYKIDAFQLDYASLLPLQGITGTLGIQQVSLTLRLGKPPADPIEKQLIKEKEGRIRAETEARYAKAEADRLKKQLYALTEAKTQAERLSEQKAAEQALKEAQELEDRAAKEKTSTDKLNSQTQSIYTRYTAALADYNSKVTQGMGLEEKRRTLEKILADFTGKGVDLGTVQREIKNLKGEESKAKKDFDLSMNFYRRLVDQGASADERRGMLERIIQKYKGSGINVSAAEEEMKLLK
ncbi:MAG: hypothetical protein KCHDKBKB_02029 [Elusimicrobia bacterium]|nr:hypothetical protein [Elusimicrobiota bacterium]